jgi:hypothetical protein
MGPATNGMSLANFSRLETEAELFELPKGFKVVDHRQSDPPAVN